MLFNKGDYMSIKMKVNNKDDAICLSCGASKKESLDIFDVKVGSEIFQLCDFCMESMLFKSVKAVSHTNGRVKSKKELCIINERKRNGKIQ